MKTTDDRGRPVRFEALDRTVSTQNDRPPLRYSPLQLERQRRSEGVNFRLFAVGIGAAMVALLLWYFIPQRQGAPSYAGFLFVTASFVIMAVTFQVVVRRASRIQSIHHMPSIGLCPACGYGIRGVPPESDGCTVCPECGAAWRVLPTANESDQSSKSSD